MKFKTLPPTRHSIQTVMFFLKFHNRRMPTRVLVTMSLAVYLLFTSCTSRVSQESRQLAQSFEQKSVQEPHVAPPVADAKPRVYLDASLSMSGYVTGKPDNQTEFDKFVDKLGDYLPGCRIYKFGQGDHQDLLSPANFDRSVHARGFYSLNYNPNDALIREINAEPELALSIIVTDGV